MKRDDRPPFDPGEEDLPRDWSPDADRDAVWDGIVSLMKEADDPEIPPPARFDAVRLAARQQLVREGLIRTGEQQAADPGFLAWLRTLLLGGGVGGQLMRIGAVGAFAFYLGSDLVSSDSSPGSYAVETDKTNSSEVAQAPRGNESPTVAVGGDSAGDKPSDEPTAQAADSTGLFDGSTSIEKSVANIRESEMNWDRTAPREQLWAFQSREQRSGARPVSAQAAGALSSRSAPASTRDALATEALEHLQVLKFSSLVNSEEGDLAHIRRIEQILSEIQGREEGASDSQSAALERYRRAEYALAARRYSQAQQMFEEAALIAPGTSLAFLARFQIGRIAFEHTQDYDLALEAFRHCLEAYPAQGMPTEYRRYLEERVEILSRGVADNWESLSHWQAAESATLPNQAAAHLLEVVKGSPSDGLAAAAADRLKDLAVADATQRQLNPGQISEALRERASEMSDGQESARVLFALAEINARRSQNLGAALLGYRQALASDPEPQLERLIRSRMNLIMNERLTGIGAPE